MPNISAKFAAQIAGQGARTLAELVTEEGKFIYRYRAASGPKAGRKYNALRHCGTAWAMLDVARQLGSIGSVAQSAERAVRYLVGNYLLPYGDNNVLCVVDSGKMQLGGNGLALLALAELFELTKNHKLLEVARKLGQHIILEQRPDGDFVHSREYATQKERNFRSDYYTGEALFGLLRLYEVTNEKQWLECAINSESQLFKRQYGVSAQSHWMLYALEHLYRARPAGNYLEHARQIAEHIVLFPDYRKKDRSTPIACRTEGLLAYVRMLKGSGTPIVSPDVSACLREIRENLGLQLKFKTPRGEFIRGGGSDEVRIDYIQHNMSSFLAYGRL
jgi:hypothetical protein